MFSGVLITPHNTKCRKSTYSDIKAGHRCSWKFIRFMHPRALVATAGPRPNVSRGVPFGLGFKPPACPSFWHLLVTGLGRFRTLYCFHHHEEAKDAEREPYPNATVEFTVIIVMIPYICHSCRPHDSEKGSFLLHCDGLNFASASASAISFLARA